MRIQTKEVVSLKSKITDKKDSHIPDFLIIGAGKSGTTSLDNYLKQHPQIFIPSVKEPNFYGYELMKPADFNGAPDELKHYKSSVTNYRDYIALFEKVLPGQIIGETSNTYMYHEHTPERIKHYNSNMKLIAVLRQPTERLYSRFLHLAREDRRPTEQFADCLIKNTVWWERNDLIKEGFYYKHLQKFYNFFPAENIRVFLYEEFNTKTQHVLNEIYDFIGVDSAFKADLSVRYNESGFIKNKLWDKVYGQKGLLIKTVKALLPTTVSNYLKENIYIQKRLNNLRSTNLLKPSLDPVLKHKITHEIYGDDILHLQTLINKDLSHWLKAKHDKEK
jgi:hypothetical protein